MSTNNKTGLVDFFYLLRRRNVPFEQWCKNQGIQTKQDFQKKKIEIEAQGEYYFESEMEKTKTPLLSEVQEPIQEQDSTQASPEEQPASPDPTEAQETLGSHKKNRK